MTADEEIAALRAQIDEVEARRGRTSDRARAAEGTAAQAREGARAALASTHDLGDKMTDYERALMAHVKRIERQNDRQTTMLQWARVLVPLAIALSSLFSALIHR